MAYAALEFQPFEVLFNECWSVLSRDISLHSFCGVLHEQLGMAFPIFRDCESCPPHLSLRRKRASARTTSGDAIPRDTS